MASQSRIIACGKRMALLAMGMKFVMGPALMAVSSMALGLKGTLFKVAIVQVLLHLKSIRSVWISGYKKLSDFY